MCRPKPRPGPPAGGGPGGEEIFGQARIQSGAVVANHEVHDPFPAFGRDRHDAPVGQDVQGVRQQIAQDPRAGPGREHASPGPGATSRSSRQHGVSGSAPDPVGTVRCCRKSLARRPAARCRRPDQAAGLLHQGRQRGAGHDVAGCVGHGRRSEPGQNARGVTGRQGDGRQVPAQAIRVGRPFEQPRPRPRITPSIWLMS